MFFQNGPYFQEEVGLEKGLICSVVGPSADDAGLVPVAEPIAYSCNAPFQLEIHLVIACFMWILAAICLAL